MVGTLVLQLTRHRLHVPLKPYPSGCRNQAKVLWVSHTRVGDEGAQANSHPRPSDDESGRFFYRLPSYSMPIDTSHGHQEPSVPASEFKQHCLALLDRVAETGIPIVVTERGRLVARVAPIESPRNEFDGSLRVLTEDDEELYTTGDIWEVEPAG